MSLTPNTNIAKKILTAVSGLLIFGFLTGHFLGNLLLFVGAEPFNIYAHQLTSNPLIYLAELILVIIFGSHIVTGIQVTLASRGARKKGYEVRNERTPKSWIVKSMPYTGTIIFLFIIFHIISFKFGPGFDESARINEGMLYLTMEGEPIRDLYKLVVVRFTNPAYSIFYVILRVRYYALCIM